jgi:hypothetical protein
VSVEDEKCSGWPSTSKTTDNVEKIWELIHEDRHQTIHKLTGILGISYGVCQEVVTENLNMQRIAISSGQRAFPIILLLIWRYSLLPPSCHF